MSLRINTSPQSFGLQRRDQQLALNLARLNSGSRITKAADNPAGLIISEQMRAQLDGLNQARDNIAQGISSLRTAEGGLEGIQDLLQQQRGLALQARSTATIDPSQRKALETQFQALGKAIDALAKDTQYAGAKLLDGSYQGRPIQTGTEAGQQVDVTIASNATGTPAGFDRAGLGISGQTLATDDGIAAALKSIDRALDEVGQQRGYLGALEANQLDTMRNSLGEATTNLAGARSTIADVDYAEEIAGLVRNQILMQSAIAARSQQNVTAGSVMRLLGA